jgi:hypothetical protein
METIEILNTSKPKLIKADVLDLDRNHLNNFPVTWSASSTDLAILEVDGIAGTCKVTPILGVNGDLTVTATVTRATGDQITNSVMLRISVPQPCAVELSVSEFEPELEQPTA